MKVRPVVLFQCGWLLLLVTAALKTSGGTAGFNLLITLQSPGFNLLVTTSTFTSVIFPKNSLLEFDNFKYTGSYYHHFRSPVKPFYYQYNIYTFY